MARDREIVQDVRTFTSNGDCEDLEKILTVVIKRRKTYPAKCMELNKLAAHFELLRLENAKVVAEENDDKEEFRRIIQEFKNLTSFIFTLDDLNEVKQKLDKYHKRNEEVNKYLEKRKMLQINY